ncbi:hypothetical protein ACWEOZ_17655 [Actinoplanes sp. NPDC004185]
MLDATDLVIRDDAGHQRDVPGGLSGTENLAAWAPGTHGSSR